MTAHSEDSIAESSDLQQNVTIIFLALAWFFIILRSWTRTFIIANFGWDDATMILAGMIFVVYCAALLYIASNGGGTHITSVSHLRLLTKWVVVGEATYVMAMMTLKISLGIFFARIVVIPWQRGIISLNVGINILSSMASFFYSLFRCGSNIDNYVLQQLSNRCTPQMLDRFVAYQQAAVTTLTDLIFVALTVIILWNANMSRRSKISVGFILCLATVGVICSILRFRYIEGLTKTDDFFWNAVKISMWSTIECGASIIAGCLATLRPFIKNIISCMCSTSMSESYQKYIPRSSRSNQPSELPHNDSASNAVQNRGRVDRMMSTRADEPIFMEFIAQPGEEVKILSETNGQAGISTEQLIRYEDGPIEFPWPVKLDKSKRMAIHMSN